MEPLTDTAKFITAEEALKKGNLLSKQVFIRDNHIVINIGSEYLVDLNRCDDNAKILAWVFHLSMKLGMTCDAVNRFILLAQHEHRLAMPAA